MRAALLTAFALVAITASAEAQFVPKAGLVFATLNNARPDFKQQTGYVLGASFELGRRNAGLQIQPEFLWVQKAAYTVDTEDKIFVFDVSYIEVPLLVRLNIPIEGFAPFVVAGPQASFRMSCDLAGDRCPLDMPSTDWGAAIGGGVRLGTRPAITVEGRYTFGLRNIRDISDGFDPKARTFMVLAGIGF